MNAQIPYLPLLLTSISCVCGELSLLTNTNTDVRGYESFFVGSMFMKVKETTRITTCNHSNRAEHVSRFNLMYTPSNCQIYTTC